jgi:hypothetical protein
MGESRIPRPLVEMPLRAILEICAGEPAFCIIRESDRQGTKKYPVFPAIFGSGKADRPRCGIIPPRRMRYSMVLLAL